jgi:hemerythrin-like domain-containing protein
MGDLTEFLREDHARCDNLYLAAERYAVDGDVTAASGAFADFSQAIERHFGMEENVLFPSFEEATGSAAGPTAVMRHEHAQMREMFEAMHVALTGQDTEQFLALADTLLVLMQQHNAKEERILYPMADRVLADPQAVLANLKAHG